MDDNEAGFEALDIDSAIEAIAIQLARALLAGQVDATALRFRFERVLGRRWPWFAPLIRHVMREFGSELSTSQHDELAACISDFEPLRLAMAAAGETPRVRGWYPYSPPMGMPPRPLASIRVPQLATPGDIARWLDLRIEELDGFCDFMRSSADKPAVLRHYHYRWLAKRRGGHRLIEIPKPRLRAIQRRIHDEILAHVPVHPAAHGCVRRRSTLSAALPHAGQHLVLRIDLEDFFASVRFGRICALFGTLGYPPAAARALAQLISHAVPSDVLRNAESGCSDQHGEARTRMHRQYAALRTRHLPQGAPSSPAAANLCAYRLDLRLAGAATSCGASYSRYVDDLVFSGGEGFTGGWRRFEQMAYTIILEEGFMPNYRKTRATFQCGAQVVLGLVVNRHPNIRREEYDLLKAVLRNCVRFGPDSQNRSEHPAFRAHLLGRIARVANVNPPRAARLHAEFARIDWNADATPPVTIRKVDAE